MLVISPHRQGLLQSSRPRCYCTLHTSLHARYKLSGPSQPLAYLQPETVGQQHVYLHTLPVSDCSHFLLLSSSFLFLFFLFSFLFSFIIFSHLSSLPSTLLFSFSSILLLLILLLVSHQSFRCPSFCLLLFFLPPLPSSLLASSSTFVTPSTSKIQKYTRSRPSLLSFHLCIFSSHVLEPRHILAVLHSFYFRLVNAHSPCQSIYIDICFTPALAIYI